MRRAALLSQNKGVSFVEKMSNLVRSYLTQRTSLTVDVMDQYSASAEEQDTTDCFLVFQEIGAPPRRSKYHVRDFLVDV